MSCFLATHLVISGQPTFGEGQQGHQEGDDGCKQRRIDQVGDIRPLGVLFQRRHFLQVLDGQVFQLLDCDLHLPPHLQHLRSTVSCQSHQAHSQLPVTPDTRVEAVVSQAPWIVRQLRAKKTSTEIVSLALHNPDYGNS